MTVVRARATGSRVGSYADADEDSGTDRAMRLARACAGTQSVAALLVSGGGFTLAAWSRHHDAQARAAGTPDDWRGLGTFVGLVIGGVALALCLALAILAARVRLDRRATIGMLLTVEALLGMADLALAEDAFGSGLSAVIWILIAGSVALTCGSLVRALTDEGLD